MFVDHHHVVFRGQKQQAQKYWELCALSQTTNEEISNGIEEKMPNDVGIVASQTKLWIIEQALGKRKQTVELKKILTEWETESVELYFRRNPK